MKLLKLIPAAAIVLTAFTTFEAKAGYPSGYTKKTSCTFRDGWSDDIFGKSNYKYYKLQKTDTPASYGVYADGTNSWVTENVSYKSATKTYKCTCTSITPMSCGQN
jgi:hypothetical protein